MYDNDDEFGIDSFRQDFSYVYEINKIIVNRYKRITGEDNPTDGDYMGLSSSESKNFKLIGQIDVNVNSVNLRQKELNDSGYDIAGVRVLEGMVPYDSELENGDIIEFLQNNLNSNIKEGEKYVVKFTDAGPLKGQFCFRKFEAYSLGDIKDLNI